MKARVDARKCQGHARCHSICPDLFEIDDVEGKSRVKLDTVPKELEEKARRAADTCPEEAITVIH